MAKPPLSTIGYEGRTVAEFMEALEAARVELVIDVRAVAASRRLGFSKTVLAAGLRDRGIDYLHLRSLGTPKAGREAARKGRIAEMRAIYEEQLATPEAALAMEQALDEVDRRSVALLCYEADAAGCHRTIVAERLVERGGFKVRNL
ncbi:DUF488 family protein [Allosphingosinicella sp.]|uniref:DUF488 domain-containing protein n=1 Tax=Allosphingosinicella sp. TaxID=2823234 RepID=UPI002FC1EBAC